MIPVIDKKKTGARIRYYMDLRGLSVQDVKSYLSLGCVQSVYHWLDGQSVPSLDNLYALSELLQAPMDELVFGNRRYQPAGDPDKNIRHLRRYFLMMNEFLAA